MTRRPSVPTAVRTAVSSLVRRALPAQRTRPFAVPRALAAAALASCLLAVGMPALANESAVGQVSLLIGVARVVHLDGRSEPLRRGATIQVGDRVETSANGHVHLRFIDNAAVSVRPDSVLEV
ncbi:MAG TPA: hypothetical protein VLK61_26250, partial [Aquabacterium sp.]|nr:hypothetical protein [Aquabacterium sp.]